MIPLVDLQTQYRTIKTEVDAAVARVLDSGRYVLGEEVAAFEREFAAYCGAAHGIGVNSGTSALHLALLAAGVGRGDEVITVSFTFVATVAAILYTGARPVFVDIDPLTCTMDMTRVEGVITERTKAIIPVHLYGQAADLDPLLAVARHRGLIVIEDAAQAHGAEYKGRRVGSIGDVGCFSFYPGKNLGACGEGGMVVTDNAAYARTMRMLRDWGQERRYHHQLKGFNCRLEELQAAILRVKLSNLERWTEARRQHAARYDELLAGTGIQLPVAMPFNRHVYHLYAVRSQERQRLQQSLSTQDIHTGIHYPIPVHLQQAYADLGYRLGDFPYSERAADRVLSLPLYPELTETQIDVVAEAVQSFARSNHLQEGLTSCT